MTDDDTIPATLEGIAAALGAIRTEMRAEVRGINNRLATLEGLAAVAVKTTRFEVSEKLVLSGISTLADRLGDLEAAVIGLGRKGAA